MTGTVYTCLHTNQSRSYLNHLVHLSNDARIINFTFCHIASLCGFMMFAINTLLPYIK